MISHFSSVMLMQSTAVSAALRHRIMRTRQMAPPAATAAAVAMN